MATRFKVVDAGGDNVFDWDDDGLPTSWNISFETREDAEVALKRADDEIVGIPGPMKIEEFEVENE